MIQSGLGRVLWSAVAVVAVGVVAFVFYFLTVPMVVFEIYCLAVPALPSNSFAAVQPLFSSKETHT